VEKTKQLLDEKVILNLECIRISSSSFVDYIFNHSLFSDLC